MTMGPKNHPEDVTAIEIYLWGFGSGVLLGVGAALLCL